MPTFQVQEEKTIKNTKELCTSSKCKMVWCKPSAIQMKGKERSVRDGVVRKGFIEKEPLNLFGPD